jgi:outer membrane protein assembly factor BamA
MTFRKALTIYLLNIFILSLLPVVQLYSQEATKKEKNWRITPLPVVYYSPETRLGFGALLAANFKTSPDSITTGSYLQSSYIYTINKQYEWSNTGRIYFVNNSKIFQYRIYFNHFPEYYFGYQTEDPKPLKELIEYNRIWLEAKQYWRVGGKSFYAGIFWKMNQISKLISPMSGTLETTAPPGYEGYRVMGLAPAFNIDSRDNQVYPSAGVYVDISWMAYPGFASDYVFGNFRADMRTYRKLKLLRDDVLAFQFLLNFNQGSVPFKDMAEVGGSNTMRGYYTGYYRYDNQYAFQIEYRFMLMKYVGLATWVGACLPTSDWKNPFENVVKGNAGIGLRVRINQRDKLNLRGDMGWGKGQQGLYLDAAEAF